MTRIRCGTAAFFLFVGMSAPAVFAQFGPAAPSVMEASGVSHDAREAAGAVSGPASEAVLAPEMALQRFEQRRHEESSLLAGYSDDMLMIANLPDTRQNGEYELKRSYAAPDTLRFTPVRYTGDGFVKSNVLLRLLHAEADHTLKKEGPRTAISQENYRFSYKSLEMLDGRAVYVFHAKPRKKRVGLFKGKVYLDASSGTLLRAEGTMVKSPSFFIRKLEFVQEYAQVNGFTLPTHLRSVAKVRIIGRTVVDVFHRDYQPQRVASSHSAEVVPGANQ